MAALGPRPGCRGASSGRCSPAARRPMSPGWPPSRRSTATDPGAVALAAWAEAEVERHVRRQALRPAGRTCSPDGQPPADRRHGVDGDRRGRGRPARPTPTTVLDAAAAPAARAPGRAGHLPARASRRPPQPRWRAHVGCFADQVYPLQALARACALTRRRPRCSRPPNRTAARICDAAGRPPASGGGTTTPATAPWSSASPSTASTSTRWPRWCCSTCSRPAATTTAPRSPRASAGCDDHPEVVEELVSERVRPGLAQGRPARAAQGRPRRQRRDHVAVRPGLRVPGARPAAAAGGRSTTSAAPTSSAGCSTPGCRRTSDGRLTTDG